MLGLSRLFSRPVPTRNGRERKTWEQRNGSEQRNDWELFEKKKGQKIPSSLKRLTLWELRIWTSAVKRKNSCRSSFHLAAVKNISKQAFRAESLGVKSALRSRTGKCWHWESRPVDSLSSPKKVCVQRGKPAEKKNRT
jgi:hypothetical protein